MNSKAAARLIERSGLKLLRWDPTFKRAFVKTSAGDVWIHTDGGREKVAENIKKAKATASLAVPKQESGS